MSDSLRKAGRSLEQQRKMRRKWAKMPKYKRDQCYIYFIGAQVDGDWLVKIGFTAVCVRKRLTSLQLGSPVELVLLGQFLGIQQDEIDLHAKYRNLHSHREWFKMNAELREEIKILCAQESA